MVKINQKVPDLEMSAYLPAKDEEGTMRLSQYKGKWVVMIFYPADFTFVCPTELEEAADHYEEFKKMNAEVLSVSADTPFAHKAWHDSSEAIKKVQYPMVADPSGRVCREFGTYIEEGADTGLSLRATFIIDPDGFLKAMELHDNAVGRNTEEILRKLRAMDFVRTHDGKVCPASWKPGDETLEPGMDLVGKI